MADLKLNPQRLADAIIVVQECFDKEAKAALEARAQMVFSMPDNQQKQELIKCEKVNEENYNSFLDCIRKFRDSLSSVQGLAETLAKREIETTKAREFAQGNAAIDAVSALRP